MIDLHCHILPDLDDGARSQEEALAMLRMAAETGTTDLVASPHMDERFACSPAAIEDAIGRLQSAAGDSPRIHYGCELHLTPEKVEEACRYPDRYCIGHGSYLLVEFSDFLVPKSSSAIFARMIDRGIRPVIAHPERNPILRKRRDDLERWIAQGCLLQVTASSLLGRFGRAARAASHDWLSRGLVHLLASDGHDTRHRPPTLHEAYEYLVAKHGEEPARRLLLDNPRAVLDGCRFAPAPVCRKRWWSPW